MDVDREDNVDEWLSSHEDKIKAGYDPYQEILDWLDRLDAEVSQRYSGW